MDDRVRQRGASLTEALVACALCAILLGAVLPGAGRLLDEAARERTAQRIHAALALGRTLAVYRAVPVTVCPPDEAGRCSGDWNRPMAVFEDPQRTARVTDGVERWFEATSDARIVLRAFRSRRYMRFLPNGQTDWQNGRFVVCPVRGALAPVSLVLNVQGRVRRAAPDPDDRARCPAPR
jgi:Tfp pilus assembly protein FimT